MPKAAWAKSSWPSLRDALALLWRLSRDDPLVKEYRPSRLLAAGCLGEDLFRQGRTAAALALLREAEKDEEEVLVGQDPAAPRFQGESAGSAAVLADLLLEAGRPGEALACVEGVLSAHEKAARAEQDRVRTAAKEQQEAEPVPITGGNTGALRRFLRNMPIV
ncbi:MAG TPA: hypothetical protein VH682_01065, partial [Gemmataceae bacterium]